MFVSTATCWLILASFDQNKKNCVSTYTSLLWPIIGTLFTEYSYQQAIDAEYLLTSDFVSAQWKYCQGKTHTVK